MSTNGHGTLTPEDLAMFSHLGITAELLNQARIGRVTDRAAREEYGIVGYGDMSGVVFPYMDPMTGHRWSARVRRDNPEMEGGKPRNKYISAYGDRRHLYFPPGSAELMHDPAVPIVLVEAEKSALALVTWAARMGRKLLPVAMGGCWGWRGRIGKVESSKGERVDEVGPISDLGFASSGRKVFVLLDANVNKNSKVQRARKELVRQLEEQCAEVWVADLPTVEGVNGPDDYIGTCGDIAMAAVVDAATVSGPNGKGAARETQTGHLLRLAGEAELFHTPDQKAYATVAVNGHKENWPIESSRFRQWLRRQYYSETKAAPQSQAIQDALNTLASRALFDGLECAVLVRVAAVADQIYLDLANEAWEVIEIGPDGWKLLSESPVKFRRAEGMLPLPAPIRGGHVDALKAFINVAHENDWHLMIAYLLQCFRPCGPYPILICNGEHGSAKSTTAKVLRELIDPNSASHSSPPSDVRDVMIAAHNERLVSLDNLSHIPDWLSDALCRMATGGGIRTRQLYTDTQETIIEVQRPIILNGIEQLATRPDLLDRSIVISLPKVSAYRDEQEFWTAFRDVRPRLLGAILDAVASGLCRLPHVRLHPKPRMADFAIWGTAIESGLRWEEGAFMAAYTHNRESANDAVLEGSPVGSGIEKLMVTVSAFEGTMTGLLKELELHVDEQVKSQRNWPRNPSALRNALKRLAPSLRMAGINLQFGERDMTRNRNRIVRVSKMSSASSASLERQPNQQHLERTAADSPAGMNGTTNQPSDGKSLIIKFLDSTDGAGSSAVISNTSLQKVGDDIEVEL